jgi:peptide/nickel transport system substrate-binding protein
MPIISDETTQTNLLLTGKLNTIELVGPNRSRVQHVRGVGLFKVPVAFNWLWYNERVGHVTRDRVVREALTMAVNLHTLERVDTGGLGSAATELVPLKTNPCQFNSVSKVFPKQSMKKARALLTRDGWILSKGVRKKHGQPLDITLLNATDQGASVEAANEYLQHQWNQLGAHVTLKATDTQGLIGIILSAGGAWDASQVSIGVNLPSQLVGFLSGPTPPKGENFAGINNGTYNRDVAAAMKTPGAGGCKEWKAAEKALFRADNLVPYATNPIYVASKGATVKESFGLSAVAPLSVRLIKSS